tara:strand:+ start:199 stop:375 length:177 start_codon:yes stop_codon:yes gene_type:complete
LAKKLLTGAIETNQEIFSTNQIVKLGSLNFPGPMVQLKYHSSSLDAIPSVLALKRISK